MVWAVRDAETRMEPVRGKDGNITRYREVESDPGVIDKRRFVYEPEFASVLRNIPREGNTLSPTIRLAWDGRPLQRMTKRSPYTSTGAHISIVSHITVDELHSNLDKTELANGFANRFLWICVRRSKFLPEGGQLNDDDLAPHARRFSEALESARSIGEMKRDRWARELWCLVYGDLSAERLGLLGAVTSRSEAQVMRLALIYALLDRSTRIRKAHLRAALALWEYSSESCRFIFGDRLGDPIADELLELLRKSPDGCSRTEIRDHFQRNKKRARIDECLRKLEAANLAVYRSEPTGGRPAERWSAVELPGQRVGAAGQAKDDGTTETTLTTEASAPSVV